MTTYNIQKTSNNQTLYKTKVFESFNYFRLRIAFSLLTMTPIEIKNIRSNEANIGISKSEFSFLKLIEKITNGSNVFISNTGTVVKFSPGIITNNYGDYFEFECETERNLSYYLEGLYVISLFGKESLNCCLIGSSNNDIDLSLDCFKVLIQNFTSKIVYGDSCSIDIKGRSFYNSLNKAKVNVKIPIVKFIEPFNLTYTGKFKKIKGNYFAVNLKNNNINKDFIDSVRIIFNKLINDVWIEKNVVNDRTMYTLNRDSDNSNNSTNSTNNNNRPCIAISLYAESSDDTVLTYDETVNNLNSFNSYVSNNNEDNNNTDELENDEKDSENNKTAIYPLVENICSKFLEEVYYNGTIDTSIQGLVLTIMSICQNTKLSKIKLGRISDYSKGLLKELYKMFNVKFDFHLQDKSEIYSEVDEEFIPDDIPESIIVSCLGYPIYNKNRVEN